MSYDIRSEDRAREADPQNGHDKRRTPGGQPGGAGPHPVPRMGSRETVEPGDRRYRPPVDTLYKVREGKGHTTQEGWEPENMADSWEAIDVEHAGTMEDPIPARPNMRYYPDRYYLDGGKLYKCTRDTEQAIAQWPHELVGVYFELVV